MACQAVHASILVTIGCPKLTFPNHTAQLLGLQVMVPRCCTSSMGTQPTAKKLGEQQQLGAVAREVRRSCQRSSAAGQCMSQGLRLCSGTSALAQLCAADMIITHIARFCKHLR
jgi:hypothetical protein